MPHGCVFPGLQSPCTQDHPQGLPFGLAGGVTVALATLGRFHGGTTSLVAPVIISDSDRCLRLISSCKATARVGNMTKQQDERGRV